MAALVFSVFTGQGFAHDRPGGKRGVDVASVNLYVGADFTAITLLDPADPFFLPKLLGAVAEAHGRILASDFPTRADALAEEIVRRGPELVALQEVSLIRRQPQGDSLFGGTVPATQVELDYLDILLEALERHGGNYAVVSAVDDTDIELPLLTETFDLDDVRLTDRDVILARTDLPPGIFSVSNPQGANFGAALTLPLGASLRGWCSIDVEGRGRQFRLINTHLENALPPGFPDIQGLQAAELLQIADAADMPIILTGDFNSDANGLYSPATYDAFISAGFNDVWSVNPGDPGMTWGHDELLADPAVPLFLRLDWVLYRGDILEASGAEAVDVEIGEVAPRWASDHAALFADLAIH
jgi:endonuclease/exonuclease/phosphatase family metal-dependent hydrolase